jgi:membrane protein YqaA with SNARE-associated domain
MWMLVACFGTSILTALLPWMNAEVMLLSATRFVGSQSALMGLVAVVTAGQMTGKTAMYWLARKAADAGTHRLVHLTERWRARFTQHPRSALAIVLVSALVGFPPFYAVSMAAGTSRMRFPHFLVVGSAARFVHFAIVALIPQTIWRHV